MLTTDELDGMRTTSALALPATCAVTRPSGDHTLDTATGLLEDPAPLAVWSGACRVRSLNTQGRDGEVGALHETMGRYVVTLPHDADGIEVDDFLAVVTGTDDELVGRPLRVIDVGWSEWRIDRRLVVEDLQQPRVVA